MVLQYQSAIRAHVRQTDWRDALFARPPRGFGKKMQFEVYVTSKARVGKLLEAVLPYLIVKQQRARELLAWIRQHPETRADRIVRLNRTLPRNEAGSNMPLASSY
ncbi:MAG TPA: hypothetical protein VFE98_03015 [Candidatus Bathyarchaeia archaeon]|nr:hypothetical protein [Candidatus Bathyarchaeia archaeon]